MNIKQMLLAICLIFSGLSKSETHVLFVDMGGVLLKTSKFKAFMRLGSKAIAHTDLKERFFEFANLIDKDARSKEKEPLTATFTGLRLPTFMCKWQAGSLSCQEVADHIIKETEKHPKFFKNQAEKELIIETARMLLPENSTSVTKPITQMIRTVKECREKKDKDGKCVNTIFLTSNCDEKTFEAWKKEFPQAFEMFDEDKIIISAKIKMIKPHTNFFQHVIKTYNLDPKKCTLIDDQNENIEGALKSGINGILHKNVSRTRKHLRRIGAL